MENSQPLLLFLLLRNRRNKREEIKPGMDQAGRITLILNPTLQKLPHPCQLSTCWMHYELDSVILSCKRFKEHWPSVRQKEPRLSKIHTPSPWGHKWAHREHWSPWFRAPGNIKRQTQIIQGCLKHMVSQTEGCSVPVILQLYGKGQTQILFDCLLVLNILGLVIF